MCTSIQNKAIMAYVVKDFKSNLKDEDLEKELNKLHDDGVKIISCEYIRHDYVDLNKMQNYKTYLRVIGEKKTLGKSQSQVLKG
ncbi:hypothetical protein CCP1ISM_90025 [Azospirillaceae bacterium]